MEYRARRLDIRVHHTEPGRKNQNHRAEREIGILKTRWRTRMANNAVPHRLWDYGLVYEAEIMSRTCRHHDDCSGIEILTGNTPDISEWLDFTFYDLVWYHVPGNNMRTENRRLGRWLGISHHVGSDMCYWILTQSARVIATTTVQHVLQPETLDLTLRSRIADFDTAIRTRLDDSHYTDDPTPGISPYIQDVYDSIPDHTPGSAPPDAEYGDMIQRALPDADDHPDIDTYIHANLLLDVGGEKLQARVIKRAKEPDGTRKGKAHPNPIFDTRAYLVEFQDGSVAEYTANIIAENIYSQVDSEGRSFAILNEISGHRKVPGVAIEQENGFTISANGNKVPKRTTKGRELLVEWKGGENEWLPLRDLKASNPIEVAEYAA